MIGRPFPPAPKSILPFKSLAAALLFSAVLGPVGLLYSSVWGGTFMILIGFVVVCSKLPVPIILTWLICCIWGVAATGRYNKKLLNTLLEKNS